MQNLYFVVPRYLFDELLLIVWSVEHNEILEFFINNAISTRAIITNFICYLGTYTYKQKVLDIRQKYSRVIYSEKNDGLVKEGEVLKIMNNFLRC